MAEPTLLPGTTASTVSEVPLCKCHSEPTRWNKDGRLKSGGYYRCNNREVELARLRKRYDNDPIGRIEKALRRRRATALQTLERNRERLEELLHATATKIRSTSPGTASGDGLRENSTPR